jgi:hypothetical protein
MCQATGSIRRSNGVTTTTVNDGGEITVKKLPPLSITEIIEAETRARLDTQVAEYDRYDDPRQA